jgi:hypothetical protein
MKDLKESFCKIPECGTAFNKEEVGRVLGKESAPYLHGYCCARCYTLDVVCKAPEKTKIHWIPVSKDLPHSTEGGYTATLVRGTSDRVLIFCKDGQERFGRYVHGTMKNWNVEGCAGQPDDYVTNFAYLNKPE